MKKIFLALALLLCLCQLTFAVNIIPPLKPVAAKPRFEEEFNFKRIISIYPFKAIANIMQAGYETQIGRSSSIKIEIGYGYFENSDNEFSFLSDVSKFNSLSLGLLPKFYLGKKPRMFNSAYVAPYLHLKKAKFEVTDFQLGNPRNTSASSTDLGFVIGVQKAISQNFTFDVYIGEVRSFNSGDFELVNRPFDRYQNRIGLKTGFSINFGF